MFIYEILSTDIAKYIFFLLILDVDCIGLLILFLFQVSAVPSVLAIKDGKVVDKFVGLQEEARITTFVNKLIGE